VVFVRFARAQNDPFPVLESLHGYIPVAFSGDGFSMALNGTVHDLGVSNPAAISTLDAPVAGLAIQVGSATTWVHNWSAGPINEVLPHSAGFVYPVGSWRFGLAMNRAASERVDLPPIRGTTPGGTEVLEDWGQRGRILLTGPVVSYGGSWRDHEWSIGLRGSWFRSDLSYHMGDAEETGAANGFAWAIGGWYRSDFGGGRAIQAGVAYENAADATGPFAPRCRVFVDIEERCTPRNVRAVLPARIQLGMSARPLSPLGLHVGASRVLWSGLPGDRDDATEVSAGLSLDLSHYLTVSLSVYDTGRDLEDVSQAPYGGRMAYVALGTVVRLRRSRLDVALADGRLLSEKGFENVLLRVGLSQEF
jgi:hypothetical protein